MLLSILAQEPATLLEFTEVGKELSVTALLLGLLWFVYKAYKEKDADNKALNEKIAQMSRDQTAAMTGVQEALNRNSDVIAKLYDKFDRLIDK